MASPQERRHRTHERAPSHRAGNASHRRRRRRNRCRPGATASAGSLRQGCPLPALAPTQRARAIAGARDRDALRATTAPASPRMRNVPPAESYIGCWTLLKAELGGIDASAALEVHPESAATVGGQDAIDGFGIRDWILVDLHDHIAGL